MSRPPPLQPQHTPPGSTKTSLFCSVYFRRLRSESGQKSEPKVPQTKQNFAHIVLLRNNTEDAKPIDLENIEAKTRKSSSHHAEGVGLGNPTLHNYRNNSLLSTDVLLSHMSIL